MTVTLPEVVALRGALDAARGAVSALLAQGEQLVAAYEEGMEYGLSSPGRGPSGRPVSAARGFTGEVDPTGDAVIAVDQRRVRRAAHYLRGRLRYVARELERCATRGRQELERGEEALRAAFLDGDPDTRASRELERSKREAVLHGVARPRMQAITLIGCVGIRVHRQTAILRCYDCDWGYTLTDAAVRPAAHGAATAHVAEHAGSGR